MNICIPGLWHLGSVTAACLASLGNRVVGLDFGELRIAGLSRATAPASEPGLEDLLRQGLASGKLSNGITGKLLSAVWDPRRAFAQQLDELNRTDNYVRRRIVPTDGRMDWGGGGN
jgi:UDPglucose 6-dehydrogenase